VNSKEKQASIQENDMRPANPILVLLVLLLAGLVCCAEASADTSVIKSMDNYKILAGTQVDKHDKLKGNLVIEIVPLGKQWKFAEKAPVIVDIETPAGLRLEDTKLRKQHLAVKDLKRYRFEVPYQAAAKQEYELKFKFDFVICTDTLCQKKRFELAYKLSSG
jgi:hypothetical protein